MLDSIGVSGFKGIKNGAVEHLAQINIITGKNNQAKSAFLQSLYLLNSRRIVQLIPYANSKEMYWSYQEAPLHYKFYFDGHRCEAVYMNQKVFFTTEKVEDIARGISDLTFLDFIKGGYRYFSYQNELVRFDKGRPASTWNNAVLPEEHIFARLLKYFDSSILLNRINFLSPSAEISMQLDNLQNMLQNEDEFLKMLSEAYEVNLKNLRFSPHVHGGWSVNIIDKNASRTASLDTLGDGVRMSINVLLRLMIANAKLILIDEIEAHQHVKGLRYTCRSILSYLRKYDAQLFVSTHSLEAIKILLELAKEQNLTAAVHHFILDEGELQAKTTPGLDAATIIDMTGDVRFADEYA